MVNYDPASGHYPVATGWHPAPQFYGHVPTQYAQQPMAPHMAQHAPPELAAEPRTNTNIKLPLTLLPLHPLMPSTDTQTSATELEPTEKSQERKRLPSPQTLLGTIHIVGPQTYRMQQEQMGSNSKSPASASQNGSTILLKRDIETPNSFEEDTRTVDISVGGRVLQIKADDVLDVFGSASNAMVAEGDFWQQQGPLSYIAFTKGDPFIKLVRAYTIELFRSEQFSKYIKSNKARKTNNEKILDTSLPAAFQALDGTKTEKDEADRALVDEDALLVTKINKDETPDDTPRAALFLELKQLLAVNSPKSDYYNLALTHILRILPRARALKLAILRFFMYVHPFVPILHRDTIMDEILQILTEPASLDDPYTSMHIKDHTQLHMAGQLVLIVRLGYMSLIPNVDVKSNYTDDQKALITDITRFKSDEYINAINLCISGDRIQSRSTFKHVQALTLLHYYRSVAPDDCLGLSGSDSSILLGSIVTHALTIGLNRDPTSFSAIELIPKNSGFVNTWRSLWHYICEVDAGISMHCGTSSRIPSLDISDVERPELFNPRYATFEKKRAQVHACYRRLVGMISNVRKKPKVIDLLKETSKLETLFQEMFGTNFFHEVICNQAVVNIPTPGDERPAKLQDAAMKVIIFTDFIQIGSNLWCMYYLITLHYERMLTEDKTADTSAGVGIFESFFQHALLLVYIMSYSFDKSHELFGMPYDFMITAHLERCMIKTHIFLSSFFMRLLNHKGRLAVSERTKKTDGAVAAAERHRRQTVDALFDKIMVESELFVGTFGKMSKTYINSYRLHIMACFVLKQSLENPEELYSGLLNNKYFLHEGANLVHNLPTSALEGVLRLCNEFKIAKQEQTERLSKAYSIVNFALNISSAMITPDFPPIEPDTDSVAYDEGIISADLDTIFDASSANREMYNFSETRNLHGRSQEKGQQVDLFDSTSMAGYEEVLKFFSSDGDFNMQWLLDPH